MLKKKHLIMCLLVFCLTATLLVGVTSSADYDPWKDIDDNGVINILDILGLAVMFGEEGTPINKTELLLDLQTRIAVAEADIADLSANMQGIENNQYVPFKATLAEAQILDEAGGTLDWDNIEINSLATTGDFIVTGILMRVNGIDETDDLVGVGYFTVDWQHMGNWFTDNLIQTGGSPLWNMAVEILGQPRFGGVATLPHQIAASCSGSPDIAITLRSDARTTSNLTIPADGIIVSGWKQAGDTVTVTYSE